MKQVPFLAASVLAAALSTGCSNFCNLNPSGAPGGSAAVSGSAPALTAAAPAVPKIPPSPAPKFPTFGKIERMDPGLDDLIAPDAAIEKLADGFDWSEGPVWLKRSQALVFSDVPMNKVYMWDERGGLREFLNPSGFTGKRPRTGESGSNGLTTDANGDLVLAQHGDRRIARYLGKGRFETVAEYYQYRRFNSPNDLVFDRNGNLYFTDPPYGLDGGFNSPKRELMFNGVYLRRKSGEVVLLTRDMTFPNGIALSPDERTLYVAQSDGDAPHIIAFPVLNDGTVGAGKLFFDATSLKEGRKGGPDGLKVDRAGNIFSTGPGGVMVINPEGKLLGIINTGEATANCGWGDDGSTLYITADMYLARIRTRTKGLGFGK